MAWRISWLENVRSVAGIIAAVRSVFGTKGKHRGRTGFPASRVEWSGNGMNRRMQARLEQQKNLAVLYNRASQIR